MSGQTTLETLIDFGDLPVFDATTYPMIVSARKGTRVRRTPLTETDERSGPHALTVTTVDDLPHLTRIARAAPRIAQSDLRVDGWQLADAATFALMDKLRAAGTPLGTYVGGKLYRGIITGLNEAFVIDQAAFNRLIAEDSKSAEVVKPWLRGQDLKRWRTESAGLYAIAIQNSGDRDANNAWANAPTEDIARQIFEARYPAIHDHLSRFEQKLRPRQDQGRFWWELRACAYYSEFEKPKITWGNLAQGPQFAFDIDHLFVGAPANMISDGSDELLYLIGILNSSITDYLIKSLGAERQGGYMEYKPMYVSQIPIPTVVPTLRMDIESVVRELLNAYGQGPQVAELELQLKALAYRAYGLTEAEIHLIEAVTEGKPT
ncbi:MAG: TaqI-like C-terminal specificity domain-containing protein [Aggregatilineales bacterium]